VKSLIRLAIQWLSRFLDEPPHLNRLDHLPPVDCPLLIEVGGELLKAHRTGFIAERSRQMEYQLSDGTTITGRYRWTYP
jgi:hypothetical protein